MSKFKTLWMALAVLLSMAFTVAFAGCTPAEPTPDEGDDNTTVVTPPDDSTENPDDGEDTNSDLGPYTYTDANGTLWTLIIEDNYDFILQGTKTDENGDELMKQIVGPTFTPVFGENGTITLGTAALTFYVNGEADAERQAVCNEGYQAFMEAWNTEHDAAACHIPIGINNVTMTMYDLPVELEEVAPGWGIAE